MSVPVIRSVEATYPVSVEDDWAVLSDTPRMVALDPLLVSYEPENGVMQEGTLNHIRARVGPFPVSLTSRTERLDPPHRAVFVSVRPSGPAGPRAHRGHAGGGRRG